MMYMYMWVLHSNQKLFISELWWLQDEMSVQHMYVGDHRYSEREREREVYLEREVERGRE